MPFSVRGRRRARFVLAGAAFSLLTVFTQPGVALAATVLGDGQWVTPSGDVQPATTDYSVTTTRPYWSVIFLRNGYVYPDGEVVDPPRYSLQVLDTAGTVLAASDEGVAPNFVAVDGNIRAAQTYTARVVKGSAAGYSGEQYGLTFQDGQAIIPQGRSYLSAPAGAQGGSVYVRDVYLSANTIDTINIAGVNSLCTYQSPAPGPLVPTFRTYLLASDPADPASAVIGAASALDHSRSYIENGTSCDVQLSAVITRSAWYGVVVFAPYAQMSVDVSSVPSDVIS